MADIVDPAVRRRMMSGIRRRDTKIELAVRKGLFALGYRYRVDVGKLPGRPDIVLARHGAVILVHGCFWHLHGCRLSTIPATQPEFWLRKLSRNRDRDRENQIRLVEAGWRIATVWECSIRGHGDQGLVDVLGGLDDWLKHGSEEREFAG